LRLLNFLVKKQMPKIIAIDFGLKRTGIAETDNGMTMAFPLTTIDSKEIIQFLKKYVTQNKVEVLVLGEPKRLDLRDTHSSQPVRELKLKLNSEFPELKIEMVDERFTSKMATQSLIAGGASKKKREDKSLIDQVSAAIILQSYLDSRKF